MVSISIDICQSSSSLSVVWAVKLRWSPQYRCSRARASRTPIRFGPLCVWGKSSVKVRARKQSCRVRRQPFHHACTLFCSDHITRFVVARSVMGFLMCMLVASFRGELKVPLLMQVYRLSLWQARKRPCFILSASVILSIVSSSSSSSSSPSPVFRREWRASGF